MDDSTVKITKVNNGWMLTFYELGLEDYIEKNYVYEIDDDSSPSETFIDILYGLVDLIGPKEAHDGFSKENISIRLVPGDELETEDEDE